MSITTLLSLALQAMPARALNTRSFISANGSDANSCARIAPCRTLPVAHNNTSPRGEINMPDPAGYGSVTITKSISIVNDGVGSAGILVASGATGNTINAGPNDAIHIRGLIIEGAKVGANGIVFDTGASLVVTNCVIRGVTGFGIYFHPNGAATLAVFRSCSQFGRSRDSSDGDPLGVLSQWLGPGRIRIRSTPCRPIDFDGK